SPTSTVLLATAKPRHAHRTARQRSVIGHSREHISTAPRVQWQRALHHYIQCFAHALGDIRLGCSCLAMETHSMKLSTHCCCDNLKTTQSLEVFGS
ncbi:unnamed protein product, partial [Staurois parvus]